MCKVTEGVMSSVQVIKGKMIGVYLAEDVGTRVMIGVVMNIHVTCNGR